jgi:peptidoglycan/xylan/chitin deacetylase (PgdA/CDA1 family)
MLVVALLIFGGAAFAHAAPFPFLLEAFRPARSLWKVPSAPGSPPTIYLTFDDGPNPHWTPPLLDALEEAGVHATFFLIDDHITSETEPIVRRLAGAGHAIGLHSGTRRLMLTAPDALAATLNARAARIRALTGQEPCRLFRPHAGWRSATMYEGLERAGYTLAGWGWGLWDWDWWRRPRADRVTARLARKASAGDIVVIHDGHHANPRADRRHAAGTVRLLVPRLRARGFSFGTLCDPAPPRSGIAARHRDTGNSAPDANPTTYTEVSSQPRTE